MSELALGQLKGLTINSNKITVPSGHTLYAPGHVIQTQTGIYSTQVTTTSTSFVATGLQVTITPKSTTSKILIVAHNSHESASGNFVAVTLYRNAINLGSSVFGLGCIAGVGMGSVNIIDSPATTSPVTYSYMFKSYNGGLCYANENSGGMSITALEIAA